MDFLIFLLQGALNAGLLLGSAYTAYAVPQVLRGVVRANKTNKALKSFNGSAFEPVAISVTQVRRNKAVTTAKTSKTVEGKKSKSVIPPTSLEEVHKSELEDDLRKGYLELAKSLHEAQSLPNLNVEDEHNLTVVSEGLSSSIRLFNSFTASERGSAKVVEQMRSQLSMLSGVVNRIKETYNEDVMRELKLNAAFLENKYSENESTNEKSI